MRQKVALHSIGKQGKDERYLQFVRQLDSLGFRHIASKGTCEFLAANSIAAQDATELIGTAPRFGHKTATLSWQIHGGLLAYDVDLAELESLGLPRIDLLCSILYPMEDVLNQSDPPLELVKQEWDVGGPALRMSAAKGGRIVVCDPDDFDSVIANLQSNDGHLWIDELAAKAVASVVKYYLPLATYLSNETCTGIVGTKVRDCRYGENAWQNPASLNRLSSDDPLGLDQFEVITGDPGYNNWCDIDRLLQTITHVAAAFSMNAHHVATMTNIAIGVKHGNPCGAAVSELPEVAIKKMLNGSPIAIFGGFIMTDFPINELLADILIHYNVPKGRRILDGVIAPDFTDSAIALLSRKEDRCKILCNPTLATLGKHSLDIRPRFRYVRNGFLQQPNYTYVLDLNNPDLKVYGDATLLATHFEDILLAWAVGATSNSNTITLVQDRCVIGNAVGQQDRVTAAELAINRAETSGHDTVGSIAFSDSFFPFPDGPLALIEAGVKLIFATSASIRDQEVIDCCMKHGITLCMIPDSKARAFFGH